MAAVALGAAALQPGLASAEDRGFAKLPPAPGQSVPPPVAWLYVVGIDAYRNAPELKTATGDARAVRDLLIENYQFASDRVLERYDAAATRARIIQDLYDLAKKLGPDDALVIYYAGHGVVDDVMGQGYWVPVDGQPGMISTYVSNGDIRDALGGIPARHVWLISDSCFAGSLLADRSLPGQIDDRFYREKYQRKSRVVMTSGGTEPVADQSGSRECAGHSIFSCYLLKFLKTSEQPYLSATEVYAGVARTVSINSDQTPVMGAIRKAGHEDGDFILIRRDRGAELAVLKQIPLEIPEMGLIAARRQEQERKEREAREEAERQAALRQEQDRLAREKADKEARKKKDSEEKQAQLARAESARRAAAEAEAARQKSESDALRIPTESTPRPSSGGPNWPSVTGTVVGAVATAVLTGLYFDAQADSDSAQSNYDLTGQDPRFLEEYKSADNRMKVFSAAASAAGAATAGFGIWMVVEW